MALKDIFKKKERKKLKTEEKKEVNYSEEKKELVKKSEKKEKFVDTYRILKSPHITEKATKLAEENQYIFKIWPNANKTEVKKAIEQLYGVDVLSVRIINAKSKKRALGRILGKRSGYKKAIVKIKQGQKIELLPR